jgi:hypothetical protein
MYSMWAAPALGIRSGVARLFNFGRVGRVCSMMLMQRPSKVPQQLALPSIRSEVALVAVPGRCPQDFGKLSLVISPS